jgi:hypothetical protein
LVKLVGKSVEDLKAASISYCYARCGFAMNRRTPTETGYRNHPNPHGPVDHTVPVLRVDDPDGKLRAVLFGYACHNTNMGFRKWLGDYAGYAQEYFEKDHPDVTALFLMGCIFIGFLPHIKMWGNPYCAASFCINKSGRDLAIILQTQGAVTNGTPRRDLHTVGKAAIRFNNSKQAFFLLGHFDFKSSCASQTKTDANYLPRAQMSVTAGRNFKQSL